METAHRAPQAHRDRLVPGGQPVRKAFPEREVPLVPRDRKGPPGLWVPRGLSVKPDP